MNIDIPLRIRPMGRYNVRLRNKEGEVTKETGWFDNLITNQGLDYIGTGGVDYLAAFSNSCYITRCAVGTSSTPPAFTDISLGAQLTAYPPFGSNADLTGYSPTFVSGSPSYLTASHTYIFPLGSVVGNLAEVGVGIYPVGSISTDPVSLFSHALIMSGGSPTTISVTSADQLEVTFELRWYVDTTLTPYSVTISGSSYSGDLLSLITNVISTTLNNAIDSKNPSTNNTTCTVYNGSIGTITTTPSGSSAYIGTAPIPSYVNGTYTKSYTFSADTATGNLSGGISAIVFGIVYQRWQFSISPVIAKDATKTMTLTFSISWARYP